MIGGFGGLIERRWFSGCEVKVDRLWTGWCVALKEEDGPLSPRLWWACCASPEEALDDARVSLELPSTFTKRA